MLVLVAVAIPCSILVVGLGLISATSLLAAYEKAVNNGEDAWWMRLLGQRHTMNVLSVMLKPIKAYIDPDREKVAHERAQATATKLNESAEHPPPKDGVCLLGSGTFVCWQNCEIDFRPQKAYNASFGQACAGDILPFLKPLVWDHQPRVIVYHFGANDLRHGHDPANIIACFVKFVNVISDKSPNTTILYLASFLCPYVIFMGQEEKVNELNRLAQEVAESHLNVVVLDPNARPFASDPDCYLNDGFHLNVRGRRDLQQYIVQHCDTEDDSMLMFPGKDLRADRTESAHDTDGDVVVQEVEDVDVQNAEDVQNSSERPSLREEIV